MIFEAYVLENLDYKISRSSLSFTAELIEILSISYNPKQTLRIVSSIISCASWCDLIADIIATYSGICPTKLSCFSHLRNQLEPKR
jgi:hypothetical protein